MQQPGRSVRRILIILGLLVVGGAFATLVGWDIRGWFSDLWDTLTSISAAYIIAAIAQRGPQPHAPLLAVDFRDTGVFPA
jgi:hypothetical protein